jgi:hypothetical protein
VIVVSFLLNAWYEMGQNMTIKSLVQVVVFTISQTTDCFYSIECHQ